MHVPIKTAGQRWGHSRGNRMLAIGANAEVGLNLRSAGTAEHTHLRGSISANEVTLRQTVAARTSVTSTAAGPFVGWAVICIAWVALRRGKRRKVLSRLLRRLRGNSCQQRV